MKTYKTLMNQLLPGNSFSPTAKLNGIPMEPAIKTAVEETKSVLPIIKYNSVLPEKISFIPSFSEVKSNLPPTLR